MQEFTGTIYSNYVASDCYVVEASSIEEARAQYRRDLVEWISDGTTIVCIMWHNAQDETLAQLGSIRYADADESSTFTIEQLAQVRQGNGYALGDLIPAQRTAS